MALRDRFLAIQRPMPIRSMTRVLALLGRRFGSILWSWIASKAARQAGRLVDRARCVQLEPPISNGMQVDKVVLPPSTPAHPRSWQLLHSVLAAEIDGALECLSDLSTTIEMMFPGAFFSAHSKDLSN